MLDVKRLAGDFGFAIVAQAVGLLVGFANTLLLPKLFSEATYGYWQLFIFYAGYSGFFGFGLIDGVYLILGGERRERLDTRRVNAQFWCCVAMQLSVCTILLAFGLSSLFELDRAAVIMGVALYLVFFNAGNFLGYLFQALGEVRRYSLSVIIESLVFFILMFLMILWGVKSFEPYMGAYIFSRLARLGYCLWFAKDILGAGLLSFKKAIAVSWAAMRVGVKLLISNIATLLIVGFSRFIIDIAWGIEDFAVVSLALSLVNFFMNFTGQAAMVLFPALRRVDERELQALFLRMRDGLSLALPVVYGLYVPVVAVLKAWLPNYAASFELFAVLLPLCVFNGKMDVVGMTMLKVMRKEATLLRVNVITCAASVAGALVGTYVLRSILAVLIWTVACVIARCLYTERFVSNQLGLAPGWINAGSVVVTLASVVAMRFMGPVGAELVIVGFYGAYLAIFKDETAKLLALAANLRRS